MADKRNSSSLLTIEEISHKYSISVQNVRAFASSGMFGFWKDKVDEQRVIDFLKYGTYWPKADESRQATHVFRNDNNALDEVVGITPPSAYYLMQITTRPSFEEINLDRDWIAQFYLQANRFFFPDPEGMQLVGPPGLKLQKPIVIDKGLDLPCTLYPNPAGELALLVIQGNKTTREDAGKRAKSIVDVLLDDLSFKYDQPLSIAHSLVLGIPSGAIEINFNKSPKTVMLDDYLEAGLHIPQLSDALSLYREAMSSNSPFHQFLTFWKVYENVCHMRGKWRKDHRKQDIKLHEESFPENFTFAGLKNQTFDKAKQSMNGPFRVAIAHGALASGRPRTNSKAEDYHEVRVNLPVIRYMAYVTLANFHHTLKESRV